MKYIFIIVMVIIVAFNAEAAVETHVVEYEKGAQVFEGYLAFDNSINGKRPGVLIIHQWKGLGKYERMRAEQLAELGYVAFAADVYGKGERPSTSQEAGAIWLNSRLGLLLQRALKARLPNSLSILRMRGNASSLLISISSGRSTR